DRRDHALPERPEALALVQLRRALVVGEHGDRPPGRPEFTEPVAAVGDQLGADAEPARRGGDRERLQVADRVAEVPRRSGGADAQEGIAQRRLLGALPGDEVKVALAGFEPLDVLGAAPAPGRLV